MKQACKLRPLNSELMASPFFCCSGQETLTSVFTLISFAHTGNPLAPAGKMSRIGHFSPPSLPPPWPKPPCFLTGTVARLLYLVSLLPRGPLQSISDPANKGIPLFLHGSTSCSRIRPSGLPTLPHTRAHYPLPPAFLTDPLPALQRPLQDLASAGKPTEVYKLILYLFLFAY